METRTILGTILEACILALLSATAAGAQDNGHAGGENEVSIEHAEIILAPPSGEMMAGYLTIWNGTLQQVDLTSIESAAFGSISLHKTVFEDAVASVRPLAWVPIPGHAELLMQRGGIHLLLGGPTIALQAGDTVDLELTFHDGTRASAEANVLPVGAKPTDHHHGEEEVVQQ